MQAFFASFANAETSCFRVKRLKMTSACALGSILALSVFASQIHLSQRERPWHGGKVSGQIAKCVVSPEALPLRKDFPRSGGRCRAATKGGIWQSRQALTERASPLKLCAAAVPLYDPSRENGIPERPQTLRYSETIK